MLGHNRAPGSQVRSLELRGQRVTVGLDLRVLRQPCILQFRFDFPLAVRQPQLFRGVSRQQLLVDIQFLLCQSGLDTPSTLLGLPLLRSRGANLSQGLRPLRPHLEGLITGLLVQDTALVDGICVLLGHGQGSFDDSLFPSLPGHGGIQPTPSVHHLGRPSPGRLHQWTVLPGDLIHLPSYGTQGTRIGYALGLIGWFLWCWVGRRRDSRGQGRSNGGGVRDWRQRIQWVL